MRRCLQTRTTTAGGTSSQVVKAVPKWRHSGGVMIQMQRISGAAARWREFRQIMTRSSGRRGATARRLVRRAAAALRCTARGCTFPHSQRTPNFRQSVAQSGSGASLHARQRCTANTAVCKRSSATLSMRSRQPLTMYKALLKSTLSPDMAGIAEH